MTIPCHKFLLIKNTECICFTVNTIITSLPCCEFKYFPGYNSGCSWDGREKEEWQGMH